MEKDFTVFWSNLDRLWQANINHGLGNEYSLRERCQPTLTNWRPIIESDSALRVKSMRILIKHLGPVNAERFVNSIKADNFDYTEWQRDLWDEETIDEIYEKAAQHFHRTHENI